MLNHVDKILFLGAEGSNTQCAMYDFMAYFGINCECESISTIKKIIDITDSNPNVMGVVPVENSLEGIVRETVDNLLTVKSELTILAEKILPISHCLFGSGKIKDITTIISHPQALRQCQNFISDNFGTKVNLVCADSTSQAVKSLQNKDKSYAAIGNELCEEIYGVKILKKNINDTNDNQTRFALLGNFLPEKINPTRTSVAFSTKNEAGALLRVLDVFKKYNLNLVYLESRPNKASLGEYIFFADIDKGINEIFLALDEIKSYCSFYKLLGSYPIV